MSDWSAWLVEQPAAGPRFSSTADYVQPWPALDHAAWLMGAASWETTILINAGAAGTDDNDVLLTIDGSGQGYTPAQMAFSDDGSTWGPWEDYATSRAYKLSPQTAYPTQTKTVYVKFKMS